MADVIISPEVKERLDKMDWKGLQASTGITRAQIEKSESTARQLAFGQVPNLGRGFTADIEGEYALRAIPRTDDQPWKIKAYTIESEKKPEDNLYLYGARIYSEEAKKALFEMTTWEGADGKKQYGRANANAGRPIGVEFTDENGNKEKKQFIVSLHQPTNRLFAIPVDALEKMMKEREVSVYGKKLDDKQISEICKGGAVVVKDCKRKDGSTFDAAVQFDVAQRQLVPVHPTWLKKAQRAGLDVGIGTKAAEVKEQAPAETKAKENKKAETKAETQETKRGNRMHR